MYIHIYIYFMCFAALEYNVFVQGLSWGDLPDESFAVIRYCVVSNV